MMEHSSPNLKDDVVEKLGWRAWIVHTKLYGRSDYLSTFCSGSFGHAKPTTQGVQYNKECRFSIQQKSDETNIELSSIYLEIWPHYIGNPHTNERDLSAGIDRLSRADFGMPAEPRLATLS